MFQRFSQRMSCSRPGQLSGIAAMKTNEGKFKQLKNKTGASVLTDGVLI
jgi:hypothetical protein